MLVLIFFFDGSRPQQCFRRRLGLIALMFAFGAAVYSLIETLWRGYTHWSMSVTGGACMATFYALSDLLKRRSALGKCAVGAAVITLYEYVAGCVVNLKMGWNIWDYSQLPGNLKGQICPLFSFFWFLLSAPAFFICDSFRRRLGR